MGSRVEEKSKHKLHMVEGWKYEVTPKALMYPSNPLVRVGTIK